MKIADPDPSGHNKSQQNNPRHVATGLKFVYFDMVRYCFIALCICVQILLAQTAHSQTIPHNRLTDWSKAGLADTLPDFGNVINIMNYGAVADGVTPNDTAIQNAIAALGTQPGTIYIPAGSYYFTRPVNLERDSMIIKGDGVATRLLFRLEFQVNNMFNIRGQIDKIQFAVQQGINRNDDSLILADTAGIHPGSYLYLFQNDSSIIFSSWAMGSAGQILKVKSRSGNTVYTEQPIRRSYDVTSEIRIYRMKPVNYVGIECLYIQRLDTTAGQTNNICFNAAANCWLSGIESNTVNFSHASVNFSTHIQIQGCYFHHAHSYGGLGEAYGVTLQYTSGDCLVENNVFEHLRHSMLVQAGANGNVFAYNYSTDPYWTQQPFPSDAGGDMVCHGNYPYMNLFEGNIAQSMVVDNSHGINGPYNTFFRNRGELYGIFTVDGFADSMNYIGNEITHATKGNSVLNGKGFFEHGNNLRGAIQPVGTTNLPEYSLYRNSPPGYWSGKVSYPGIGSPQPYNTTSNPARERYQNSVKTDCTRNPKYVGVGDVSSVKQDFSVAPNPFDTRILLTINEFQPSVLYHVYDVAGRCVQTGSLTGVTTTIDAAALQPGFYIIQITDSNGHSAKSKIVKTR